jgi:hypothetical protein
MRELAPGISIETAQPDRRLSQPWVPWAPSVYKKAPLLTVHTREVCEDYNNGWMSAMETRQADHPPDGAGSSVRASCRRDRARQLALWAQKTALAYELTSDTDHVATVGMGQEVRVGRPVRGSQVWAARNTRDSGMGIALAQIDVSATPVPQPGPPDRRALMMGDRLPPHQHADPCRRFTRADVASALPGEVDTVWPTFGAAEFPPLSPITADERTEILIHTGRWIPPVHVPGHSAVRPAPVIRPRKTPAGPPGLTLGPQLPAALDLPLSPD